MPSPKPIPKALKIVRGNPGRRPLNEDEPEFEAGIPDKPDWFNAYASEEWDRLVGNLNGQRVFTKNDLGIMVSICLAYEEMRDMKAQIDLLGYIYCIEDMGGQKHYKPRPECTRFETALREYRMLLGEIGFTPSSRTKIKRLPEPKKKTGIDRFFTS